MRFLKIILLFEQLAERCLIQNNSLNIYERHFQPPDWDEPEKFSPPEISLLGHFPDQCKTNIRPVQQVHIEPLDGIHVIGAYAHTTYMKRDYSIETENYIWDISKKQYVSLYTIESVGWPLFILKYLVEL